MRRRKSLTSPLPSGSVVEDMATLAVDQSDRRTGGGTVVRSEKGLHNETKKIKAKNKKRKKKRKLMVRRREQG